MKVKMLRNPGKDLVNDPEFKLKEGETGTVKKDLGEKLIKLRIAEPADGDEEATAEPGDTKSRQKQDMKAVPPKAEVADPKPEDFNKIKR